eukprot:GHVR01149744.1.p1 GENE.GHVR01149744.1~~GHVR01149744.1.p1  ORF type:complete len:415 (-),score=51.12 GHVR01149744.1:503-1747(-)
MNVELYLLKLFFSFEIYNKYFKYLKKQFVKDNSKELSRLFETISVFHEKWPGKDIQSVPDLEAFYYACYPIINGKEKGLLDPLFEKLLEISPDPSIAESIIRSHVERVCATEIALKGMEVAEGKTTFDSLATSFQELELFEETKEEQQYVTDDLEDLLESTTTTPGLRWRLDSMNKALGSIRKGDFGFIFKRPETGGTTFLASECTHFATQTEQPIIWFNNEEQGKKVKLRCFQAFFGLPLHELTKDYKKYNALYQERIAGRICIVDDATLSRSLVEHTLRGQSPSLIIFDQLDKVKGFNNDRTDLELKAIYQWARELAKTYAPVIGVCQAGATAEGKKYLNMDDVDNSKTGKQGEADWILGIGKSNQQGYESLRHFHLCKNKLIGDADTLPERRHWSWDVLIEAEIARYRDHK